MEFYILMLVVALAEALFYWAYEIFLFILMLKGKISPSSYHFPLPGLIMILMSWFPVFMLLTWIDGKQPHGRPEVLLSVPIFLLWVFILRNPMISWRSRIYRSAVPSPEYKREFARSATIANYLDSGGLG